MTRKRPTDPEIDRLLALAEDDPRAALEGARKLRGKADVVEGAAIRAALHLAGWLVAKAAKTLGMAPQVLQGLLAAGRRHAAIGAEVAAKRHEMGYRTGRPPGKDSA